TPMRAVEDSDDDSDDDEDAREARQTAEAIRRSFSVDLFAPIKLPEPVDDTLGPLLPSSNSSVSNKVNVTSEPVLPSAPAAAPATLPQDALSEDVTTLFGNIPQSMAEIYKLSNKNKKRKKKKGRDIGDSQSQLQQNLKSPQSPFYLNDGEK